MLVCNVSLRPPRSGLTADIAEAIEATDATATGNIVFATLVDDPASVGDIVDAYLGEIMLEAASADDSVSVGLAYAAAIDEAVTAVETTSGSIAAPGTPDTILTGLIGWWDASVTASLTLAGAAITNVADQSGTGHHLGDGTSTNKPQYSATGLNSLPTMTFSGSQAISSSAAFSMGTGNTLTVFIVGILTTAAQNYARALSYLGPGGFHDYDNAASWVWSRDASNAGIQYNHNGGYTSVASVSYSTPFRAILTISSGGAETIYINGVSAATGTSGAGNFASPGELFLGISKWDGAYWGGAFSEVGIATGYSDATAVAALDLYLKNKWGL